MTTALLILYAIGLYCTLAFTLACGIGYAIGQCSRET